MYIVTEIIELQTIASTAVLMGWETCAQLRRLFNARSLVINHQNESFQTSLLLDQARVGIRVTVTTANGVINTRGVPRLSLRTVARADRANAVEDLVNDRIDARRLVQLALVAVRHKVRSANRFVFMSRTRFRTFRHAFTRVSDVQRMMLHRSRCSRRED